MRRLAVVLVAAMLVGWASPLFAGTVAGKVFLVKIWGEHGRVRDRGLVRLAYGGRLDCWWFQHGVFCGGWWDERDGGTFCQWDGWYEYGDPSPYDDFEGYYYAPGDFVYGWVQTPGAWPDYFFYGPRYP